MSGHRERYKEIAAILSRHGMGYLVGILGLEHRVPFQRDLLGHERRGAPYTRPEHLRLALEELGATFVKLGQLLSTRPDLLPPEYQAELAKLQDAAPPVPGDVVRELVAQELGQGPEQAFASFDVDPLAAASIGQAHAATLHDGTEVVVKVRRPRVVEQVEEDLEILQNLAAHAGRHWQAAADYDLVALADEFAQTLRAELDYLREGRSADRFAADFAGDPDVHIPRVFWETTTSRVLTLERIRGITVSDLDSLDAAGIDRHALAQRATRVTAEMIFESGFFHADPHPGNLFIEAGGRIGLIDFGMVGELDERLREQLGHVLIALAGRDYDRFTDVVLELGVARVAVSRAALRDDLVRLIAPYEGRPIGEIAFGRLIQDVFTVVRQHRLRLPRELVLLLKMVVMNEGMAAQLDPEFQLGEILAPYAQRLVARQLSPAVLAQRLAQAGIAAAQLGLELPEQLRRLLAVLDRGDLEAHLRTDELGPLVARAERLGNRLVAGVLAAAFIQGLAELMAVDPKRWRQWEGPLFAGGLGAASTLGAYLAWTARRDRRRPRR